MDRCPYCLEIHDLQRFSILGMPVVVCPKVPRDTPVLLMPSSGSLSTGKGPALPEEAELGE